MGASGRNEKIAVGIIVLGAGFLFMGNSFAWENNNQNPLARWVPLLKSKGKKYSVPWRWMAAIMGVESDYGRTASVAYGLEHPGDVVRSKSSDGKSTGLMQVTAETATWMAGRKVSLSELNNPDLNVEMAAKYLAYLIGKFKTDRDSIFRAYNGGPGFKSTAQGLALTPVYNFRVQSQLKKVLEWYPGNEMEIG